MTHGVTKWFDAARGFGFITLPDGTEVFVHVKQILADNKLARVLFPGDQVSFEIEQHHKGARAMRVRVVKRMVGPLPPDYSVQRHD